MRPAVALVIVVCGEVARRYFGNHALMYLTATGVPVMLPMPNPCWWLAATAGGGGASIAGVVAMVRIVTPRAASLNA